MGWFFLIGLAISLLLLYGGSGIGFLTVLGTTFLILIVWGIARKSREQKEDFKRADEIEETQRLLHQFGKETNVLVAKLQNGETISPEAANHYEQTYSELMPLLRKYSYTLDRLQKESREEEGDFSDEPGIVKTAEDMHNKVRRGIAGQELPDFLSKQLSDTWESLYSLLLEKVNARDFASQDVRDGLNQLLEISKQLFPLLPEHQIDEFQSRVSILTGTLKARAAVQMDDPSSNGLNGNCQKCAEYYPVLRLKPDATEEEVKTAYRDLAQIYHPDRFNDKNERLRRTAEEQLKEINEAYGHIRAHIEPVR